MSSNVTDNVNPVTSALKETAADNYDSTRDHTHKGLNRVRESAATVYQSVKGYAHEAYVAWRTFVIAVDVAAEAKRLNDKIHEKPLIAAGAGFVAGCLTGFAFRRGQ